MIFTTPSFYDVSEKSRMDPFLMISTLQGGRTTRLAF